MGGSRVFVLLFAAQLSVIMAHDCVLDISSMKDSAPLIIKRLPDTANFELLNPNATGMITIKDGETVDASCANSEGK
jgi:hypothetical protein